MQSLAVLLKVGPQQKRKIYKMLILQQKQHKMWHDFRPSKKNHKTITFLHLCVICGESLDPKRIALGERECNQTISRNPLEYHWLITIVCTGHHVQQTANSQQWTIHSKWEHFILPTSLHIVPSLPQTAAYHPQAKVQKYNHWNPKNPWHKKTQYHILNTIADPCKARG